MTLRNRSRIIEPMNRLSVQERARIVACLCEGMSMRATVRMTGFAKRTVERTLREVGEAVWIYQDEHLRELPSKRVECDEIWSFCYAKQKNVPKEHKGEFGFGDMWTWTAICADTKIIPCWLVSDRSHEAAVEFMMNLVGRLENRVQLTSDGLNAYIGAVEEAFGMDVDFAQLIKTYGPSQGQNETERKYSPGEVSAIKKYEIMGNPDPDLVSTSYAERQNLTMRMQMRRFTRLTNAFSKKVQYLEFAVALYFMYYNFCRKHQTLKSQTPAMAAGVADHVWTIEEITALAEPVISSRSYVSGQA